MADVDRRALLRGLGAAGLTTASAGLSGCLTLLLSGGSSTSGSASISFASQRQRVRRQDATVIVRNRTALVEALKTPGAVIWIPGWVTINLTGYSNIQVAPNITIASNRHLRKGTGALLRFDDYAHLFTVPQGSARVTGLRLRGPYTKYRDFPTDDATYAHAASGITFEGLSGIVDNCELWGWTAYAIGAGTKETATQMWIHHNEIHHNQMGGLGYALESLNGMSLIEWNYFSHYRHVVSGYGYTTNGYEFRCNVVGPPGNSDPARFPCDMHSLGEQPNFPQSVQTAGKYINAHHNVFELTEENAMSISGTPTMYARFCNNWTAHSKGGDGPGEPAVFIDGGRLKMHDNHFGQDALKPGRRRLKQMSKSIPISNGKPSPSAWSPSAWSLPEKDTTTKNQSKGTNTQQQMRPPPPGERSVTEVS